MSASIVTVTDPTEVRARHDSLTKAALSNSLTREKLQLAISAISDLTLTPAHSIGLQWMDSYPDAFRSTGIEAYDLFMEQLDNPHITKVLASEQLFELVPAEQRVSFMTEVASRYAMVDCRWIGVCLFAQVEGPLLKQQIFARLEGGSPFTLEECNEFAQNFLVGDTGCRQAEDWWWPLSFDLSECDLGRAIDLCVTRCPEVFFAAQHQAMLRERFNYSYAPAGFLGKLYEEAANRVDLLDDGTGALLEQCGLVTGVVEIRDLHVLHGINRPAAFIDTEQGTFAQHFGSNIVPPGTRVAVQVQAPDTRPHSEVEGVSLATFITLEFGCSD